jgi:hypothetical protein
MCTSTTDGREFYSACRCAGTGCGGHVAFRNLGITWAPADTITWTPAGYQGAAQHTYTAACAGHHPPGPCPPSQEPARVQAGS